jgi:adenylate cyclase
VVIDFRVGNWLVQPDRGRLVAEGREELLEPKTMAVLVHLARHAGEVVSAEALIEAIWNNRPLGENPVYKCVNRLRKVFGDDPQYPIYIETIPRKGYRLAVPVTEGESDVHEQDGHQRPAIYWLRNPRVAGSLATLAMLVAIASWQLMPGQPTIAQQPQEPILAVLPFGQVAAADSHARLSGSALSRELSSQLARIPGLQVIAHDSVMVLADAQIEPAAVGARLGVNYLIDGEFQETNGGLSVAGRLINLTTGEQLRFISNDPSNDTLAIVFQISESVADALGIAMEPEWLPRCGGSRNIEACQRYRLAQEHIRMRSPHFRRDAIDLLEEAIAIDPEFAGAYAQLAVTHLVASPDHPWPQAMAKARTAVERALELDSELPETLLAKAAWLMADPQGPCPPNCWGLTGHDRAEELARKALIQRSGDPHAHNVLAIALSSQGQQREAYSHIQQALRMDPLNPFINYNASLHRSWQGDQHGAESSLMRFVERLPTRPTYLYSLLAQISNDYGEFDRSLHWLAQMGDVSMTSRYDGLLADSYYNLGMTDALEDLFARHQLSSQTDPRLLDARRKMLASQGDLSRLDQLASELEQIAQVEFGDTTEWPRHLLQHLAMNHFSLGNLEQSAQYFELVFGRNGGRVTHQHLILELDGLHMYAFALQGLGEASAAGQVLEASLDLIGKREQQGHGNFPQLIAARARTHAMQGQKALAIAGLRRAFAHGWRNYACLNAGDPRWAQVAEEPDFLSLVSIMRVEVAQMKDRLKPHLTSLH